MTFLNTKQAKFSKGSSLKEMIMIDYGQIDRFLSPTSAIGEVVIRPAKLRVPQELPSGYLKHSASPKS